MSLLNYFQKIPKTTVEGVAKATVATSPKPTESSLGKRIREDDDAKSPEKRVALEKEDRSDSGVEINEPPESKESQPTMQNVTVENLEETTMGKDWHRAFKSEFTKPYFVQLKQTLAREVANHTIYPTLNNIYSFTRYSPLSEIKVVILGQDPYHGPTQAHGLAFSVEKGVSPPPSLRNMFKELQDTYGKTEGPLHFSTPKHGCLEGWSRQGVLLLNAALTVQAGKANSHQNIGWQNFTNAIIQYLASKNQCVFLLWGNDAQKKQNLIKGDHLILKSVHPSPLSAHRGFLGCGHFIKANEWLKAKGKPEIRWGDL